jgi:hypothetical protein
MIVYDFETITETRIDEDGNEYQTEIRGPLQVWFFDSNPDTDPPDQTYDWRAADDNLTWSNDQYPIQVKSECAFAEVAEVYPNLGQREIRILGEGALEKIEQR